MAIYVSGSLAFDRIMTFHGNFQDHVLMDKLHMLNILWSWPLPAKTSAATSPI